MSGLASRDRRELLRLLGSSAEEFLGYVESLSEEAWSYRPDEESWTVGEVAEHLVLAERQLFSGVEHAVEKGRTSRNPLLRIKSIFLAMGLTNRFLKVKSPSAIRPERRWSRTETLDRYKEERKHTRDFVQSTDAPLRRLVLRHPLPYIGTISAYDWVAYIPHHNIRHNKQVREIHSSPDFPYRVSANSA